jgi:hypothetical protein
MMFGFGDKGTTNLMTRALESVGQRMATVPDPTQIHYHLPASKAHPRGLEVKVREPMAGNVLFVMCIPAVRGVHKKQAGEDGHCIMTRSMISPPDHPFPHIHTPLRAHPCALAWRAGVA